MSRNGQPASCTPGAQARGVGRSSYSGPILVASLSPSGYGTRGAVRRRRILPDNSKNPRSCSSSWFFPPVSCTVAFACWTGHPNTHPRAGPRRDKSYEELIEFVVWSYPGVLTVIFAQRGNLERFPSASLEPRAPIPPGIRPSSHFDGVVAPRLEMAVSHLPPRSGRLPSGKSAGHLPACSLRRFVGSPRRR